MGNADLDSLVYWTPDPETALIGTLIAFSDPDTAWIRWAGRRGEERVSVDELAVLA